MNNRELKIPELLGRFSAEMLLLGFLSFVEFGRPYDSHF